MNKRIPANPEASISKHLSKDFSALQGISDKDVVIAKAREYVKKEMRGELTTATAIGQYTAEEGQRFWVCPASWFVEDDPLSVLIIDFAKECNALVKTVAAPATRSHLYSKKYMLGLWSGLYSTTIQRRQISKKDLEAGRTAMFCLLVKAAFQRIPYLGAEALIRDHFFYGNNPGEIRDKFTVDFNVKSVICQSFSEKEVGRLLYNILLETASAVGLSYLTDDEFEKTLDANLKPVDTVISSFYPEVQVKQGRRVRIKKRRPSPLRASPLFTREEMGLLTQITSFLYTDDEGVLSKNYFGLVQFHGFAAVQQHIGSILGARWELLQRFAHVTKIRLQAIRKITQDMKIKKADVSQEQVQLYLKSLPDPALSLLGEIKHLMGRISLEVAYLRTRDSVPAKPELYLYGQCIDLYRSMKLTFKANQEPSQEVLDRKLYRDTRVLASDILARLGATRKQIVALRSRNRNRVFGASKIISGTVDNAVAGIIALTKVQKNEISNAAIRSVNSLYLDIDTFVEQTCHTILKDIEISRTELEIQIKFATGDDLLQRVLGDKVKELGAISARLSPVLKSRAIV